MPLLALWRSNPEAVTAFSIEQVVSAAGDGKLRDGSSCSSELREYFTQVDSDKLAAYVDQCLSQAFPKGGMVLQDLVNELGRRLEYNVTNGRYQGAPHSIGFDGSWVSPEGHTVVVEVKTTDTYRISLDTVAGYRRKLIEGGQIGAQSSALIVVGREDTGELEAQVRGSRHAWDIRLISTDALVKLVRLKESTEEQDTGRKIRSLLVPMEYTKLDEMVDIMFTAAKDAEESSSQEPVEEEPETSVDAQRRGKGVWHFTDKATLEAKRSELVSAIGKQLGKPLLKKSRATFWDADHSSRVVTAVSKRYDKGPANRYWYAYHPKWQSFLNEGQEGFLLLGCMDLRVAFAIPREVLHSRLDHLNVTPLPDQGRMYWHLQVGERPNGEFYLQLPKVQSDLPLGQFALSLAP